MEKEIIMRLDVLLQEYGMTQKKLSELTDIRAATINEYYNNVWKSVKKKHLESICDVLKCDLSEIITQIVIGIDE